MAGSSSSSSRKQQKRMGPAPFASFEDLSDEVRPDTDSPGEPVTRLPGIHEDVTPNNRTGLTPITPRIDISRASSSSHHEDSRDSTPERELFQAQGTCTHLGLAFREEGALELRSSTEELDFQDPNEARRSPVTAAMNSQSDTLHHQRKDSQSSDYGGLLSISGRTSRLSSIGSQGSRISNASHLSVTSGMSRSPSPHKMLLETSFCGSKSSNTTTASQSSTKLIESEMLERVLLSRKHDPTEAVLAEGISIECRRKIQPADPLVQLQQSRCTPPEKPVRKTPPSSKQTNLNPDVVIKVDKPSDTKLVPGKTIVSESGVEYTFIPLKGPLPKELISKGHTLTGSRISHKSNKAKDMKTCSVREPQYIRIKLKPDHMYSDEPLSPVETITTTEVPVDLCTKPATLELRSNGGTPTPQQSGVVRSPKQNSRTPSPSVSRKSSFASLFRVKDYGTSPESPTIPSSSIRRKFRSRSKSSEREKPPDTHSEKASKHRSVFTIFKSKKSPSSSHSHKSKQSITGDSSSSPGPGTTSLHSLEFTFDKPTASPTPLNGDVIIIPLHSPGSEVPSLTTEEGKVEEPNIKTESEEMKIVSNSTKEEICNQLKLSQSNKKIQEEINQNVPETKEPEPITNQSEQNRQSSITSENLTFTTQLGSNNEIFTTKLPKNRNDQHQPEQIPALNSTAQTECIENGLEQTVPKERNNSSESEPEPEPDVVNESNVNVNVDVDEDSSSEHERKGLVLQDSYEDELPYVPTTLPQERSLAAPIVPVKQRGIYEVRTCPIERPRSTTPIHPSCLEDYCEDVLGAVRAEKLRISLPREDSITVRSGGSIKSPKHKNDAPPLPPRGAPKEWINFEEIPERRKPPKRIQTIPSRGLQPPEETNVIYSYVNPEDCKCECHESGRVVAASGGVPVPVSIPVPIEKHEEDEQPLLDTRHSDSSPESQQTKTARKKKSASNESTNAFPHVVTTSS